MFDNEHFNRSISCYHLSNSYSSPCVQLRQLKTAFLRFHFLRLCVLSPSLTPYAFPFLSTFTYRHISIFFLLFEVNSFIPDFYPEDNIFVTLSLVCDANPWLTPPPTRFPPYLHRFSFHRLVVVAIFVHVANIVIIAIGTWEPKKKGHLQAPETKGGNIMLYWGDWALSHLIQSSNSVVRPSSLPELPPSLVYPSSMQMGIITRSERKKERKWRLDSTEGTKACEAWVDKVCRKCAMSRQWKGLEVCLMLGMGGMRKGKGKCVRNIIYEDKEMNLILFLGYR